MKLQCRFSQLALLLMLLAALTLCAGCGGGPATDPDGDPQEVVVEPGLQASDPVEDPQDAEDPGEEEEENTPPPSLFTDKGENSTLEDLVANLDKIESYYFEQDIPYVDNHVYMQVWYKNGLMKVVTSVDGMGLSEYYYNYNDNTVINYAPGSGTPAIKLVFDSAGPDAPENPKLRDYLADYTADGFETIDRQTCMVLNHVSDGSTLWVSTANGFPLQIYFEDSLGDLWTVQYKNIRLNAVSDEELSFDPSIELVDYTVD